MLLSVHRHTSRQGHRETKRERERDSQAKPSQAKPGQARPGQAKPARGRERHTEHAIRMAGWLVVSVGCLGGSTAPQGAFFPRKSAPGAPWVGGFLGPRGWVDPRGPRVPFFFLKISSWCPAGHPRAGLGWAGWLAGWLAEMVGMAWPGLDWRGLAWAALRWAGLGLLAVSLSLSLFPQVFFFVCSCL